MLQTPSHQSTACPRCLSDLADERAGRRERQVAQAMESGKGGGFLHEEKLGSYSCHSQQALLCEHLKNKAL